jgi:hypothetical protein
MPLLHALNLRKALTPIAITKYATSTPAGAGASLLYSTLSIDKFIIHAGIKLGLSDIASWRIA